MPHHLTTERLHLRPITLRDAKVFWQTFNNEAYASMTGSWRYPFAEQYVRQRILKAQESGSDRAYWFAAFCGLDFVGSMLLFSKENDSIELGYAVGEEWTGQGLATEGARALAAFAFQTLKMSRVLARVSIQNPASIRILERMGFKRVGDVQMGWSEHYAMDTPYYDYALTRERYRP